MTQRIKQLPTQLANQIAAGEVIERPASVVKECLENAIDAKATEIIVEIDRGGMERIVIRDNGIGIGYDDLPLSLAPHATSKISQASDLNQINSLGFRGEALASISAVSKCTITSKTKESDRAFQIKTEGGESPFIKPAPHPNGTTVEIKALFFNVPVRRTFLKSEKTEYYQIEAIVKRIALSHDDIAFTFIHNGKLIFKLPRAISKTSQDKKITKIFGKTFFETAKPIDAAAQGIRLYGYLGSPDFMRSHNDLQYTYVNGRMVKDKLINHAIKQVYQPLMYPGRVPSYLLYLTLASSDVDVNVHPTKHEVRFRHARDIHDFMIKELSQVLLGDTASESSSMTQARIERASASMITTAAASDNAQTHPNLIDLGGGMALVFNQEGCTLLDVKRVYRAFICHKLKRALEEGTIPSRPLLVPTSFTLTEKALIHYPFDLVAKLGFDISPIDVDKLIVRALPLMTPHLDLSACVSQLQKATSIYNGIEMIAHAQIASLASLSSSEQSELIQYLLQEGKTSQLKAFTRSMLKQDWAELLNG